MRIVFLAEAHSPHSFKWVSYFTKQNHEVYWFSLSPATQELVPGARFFRLSAWFPWNVLQFKRLMREIKPDILHAHYAGRNGFLAALTGFHPFFLTVWGSDVLRAGKSKIKGPFVRYALKQADLITCDAAHMKKAVINMGVSASKVNIINFGVDTKKFTPGSSDATLARELRLRNAPVVISLRNLEPVYDIETLIRAISLVLREVPATIFVVAGAGSEENILRGLVDTLGVSNNVRFTGLISQEDMPGYLRSADVYVSCALSDAGIAGSTAEAMACGLPVVITNTGENEQWVKHGEGGYLVPVKNPDMVADAITRLLQDSKQRERFGKINRDTIEQRNDYVKEMEKMASLYTFFL